MPRVYGCRDKYKDLNFIQLKESKKYVALCNYCRKKLTNTAVRRLESHRKLCKGKANDRQVVQDTVETQIISPDSTSHYSANSTFATVEHEEMIIVPEIVFDESGRQRRNKSVESHVDKDTAEGIQDLNSKMSNFFFGCNIPLSVIDSDHFKSFVTALRPSFGKHLSGRKALSTTLLDKKYEEKANNDRPVSCQVVQDTIETQIISPDSTSHYSANSTFAPISTVEHEEMIIVPEFVLDESGRQVDGTYTTFNSSSLHDVSRSNLSEYTVGNNTRHPLQWMMDGMVKRSNTLTNSFGIDNTLSGTSSSSLPSHTIREKAYQSERRNKSIESFVDKVTAEEIQDLNSKMSNFFFGCNIPFCVIDSDHFKSFVKALRPSFGEHLLGRKALSTTLLDKKYEECIEICNKSVAADSVLLVDGWKNTSSNTKTVVTLLHNDGSSQTFLNAWDLSGEPETEDRLSSIVNESITKAKSLYNTSVYAVVSDNASNMLRMDTVPIWHSNCSSHIGNLLAKDVMDDDVTKKVQIILKEFKHTDFEKALLDQGGSRIKTPCETRCSSYRDSYECLINNIKYMKNLIENDTRFNKIKPNTVALLFDDNFIHEVEENIKILDPICNLLNICQNPNTSIADSAHLWLNFKLPGHFLSQLQHRQNMALNVYSLTAYTLHPKYCNEAQELLSQEYKEMVQDFLLRELSSVGLKSLREFQEKSGVFQVLFTKVSENGELFWEMAIIHHKELSTLSLKLLRIPASSAQNERYIHSPIRNRLGSDRFTKLLHIYYTLKRKDTNKSDEY